MRELTREDGFNAIWGGSFYACGGGGWVSHGETMVEHIFDRRYSPPRLASVSELPDDAVVVTVTAIGPPASTNFGIQPDDYVRALELVIERVQQRSGQQVAAVMTAQNGSSTTFNGWIQSSRLGVLALDAAGDVRAHPTGKLGGMGLTERAGYTTIQAAYGANREQTGGAPLELVTVGNVIPTSDLLRAASALPSGFIAAARNPVDARWIKAHAAVGAITKALELGAAMRVHEDDDGAAILGALLATSGGRVLARGPVSVVGGVQTVGGFDHATIRVADHTVRLLNEYMTVDDPNGRRLSTYPDVIALVSPLTGRPLSMGHVRVMRPGAEAVLIQVPKEDLPLARSTVDRYALDEVERIMGVPITEYALAGVT